MTFNKSMTKTPMPGQVPEERTHNFKETTFGYTPELAMEEACRCVGCKNHPCQNACPVGNDIPGFIQRVAAGDFDGAYQVLAETTSLPGICGRVCPHEKQCEGHCTRGIKGEPVAIGCLERFVADRRNETGAKDTPPAEENGHAVAIVGSGPSGLSAAGDLARLGYKVTVFEALDTLGGVLTYGIPEFRLPRRTVEAEIDRLCRLGVTFRTSMVIGKVLTIDDLLGQYGFDAVYLGSGAGRPRLMGIPGEGLKGVCTANEYLYRANLMYNFAKNARGVSKNVVVVGGGNVAMDAVRCARRLDADSVTLIYRRGMEELPAGAGEVAEALEEGVVFRTLANPVELLGDENGYVQQIRCVEMELGDPDESGRRQPVPKPGSEFVLDADAVILALGTDPSPILQEATPDLVTNRWGCFLTRENGETSHVGVYAGGDAVTGPATVVQAMAAGKRAAREIDEYIRGKFHPDTLS